MRFTLSFLINAVGIGNVTESQVVVLFIPYIRYEDFPRCIRDILF